MSKSRSTQRQHRRKVGYTAKGAKEHQKREQRRKRENQKERGIQHQVDAALRQQERKS